MFAQILSSVGSALDDAGIRYMVIGGQAVLVHCEPRLTRHIDVTVGAGVDAVPRILGALQALAMRPLPDDPLAFAAETMVLPLLREPSAIRVGVVLSWTPFEVDALSRASTVTSMITAAGSSPRRTSWC